MSLRLPAALLALSLAACGPREIEIRGVVTSGPGDFQPLAGAEVEIRDSQGESWSVTTTNGDGSFATAGPEASTIFALIGGDGLARSSFTGLSGGGPVFEVADGELFGFRDSERQAWEERFAGCPGAGEPGGIVIGEVRIFELADPVTGVHPTVGTARAQVESEDGALIWEGCYLDEEGIARDAAADRTGATGTFAVFGVEPGLQFLSISYEVTTDNWAFEDIPVWVPDHGVVPRFPVWVSFPF